MAAAAILTGVSKANTTGGTFADNLSANSNDNLTIPTTPSGVGHLIAMWFIDSDSVMDGEIYASRTESFHDTNTGFRWATPATALGSTGAAGAYTVFRENIRVPVFSGDTLTISVTTTASDDVAGCLLTLYDDLPGVGNPQFTTIDRVNQLRKSNFGFQQNPVASGTPGAWGAARALTADDNRFSANTYYALLGCTVRIPVTGISLISNLWGGQRIGLPAGALDLNSSEWFAIQSQKLGVPLIPYFAQADAANINVYAMDGEASTSPHVAWNVVELTGAP